MVAFSSPRRRIGLALGAAAALAGALVAASLLGSREEPTRVPVASQSQPAAADGVAQRGTVLGRADAPVTLVEYADLQCPYCAEWSRRTFPALVSEYVRAGKLRIEFRGLAFLGTDSETALRAVVAAGAQNRLWDVLEALYLRQGAENSGWVNEDALREVSAAVGLDAGRLDADRAAGWVTDAMLRAARQAGEDGVAGTPSFALGRTGRELQPIRLTSLGPDGLRPAIDRLLAS
jgi:protein-disulfide isomerase